MSGESHYHMDRVARNRLVDQVADKLNRGTPNEVILRYILNNTEFTLPTARQIVREAKFRVDPSKRKEDKIA